VSSSFGGRVSPMTAKLSVDRVPPPGPIPELPDELLVELALLVELVLLVELDELPEQEHGPLASVTHCASQLLSQQ
jgi:hypothetical protein